MGLGRDIECDVRNVRADGTLDLPGGICARIGSGAPGTTLTFPIVGAFDDGVTSKVVFLDTGPTPLLTSRVDEQSSVGFPKITLSGLPSGTAIAFAVAKTREAARYLAAGGQLATDSSGRLVIVTPGRNQIVCKNGVAALVLAPSNAVALWTPAAGKKIRLLGGVITHSVAGEIDFGDQAAVAGGTNPIQPFRFAVAAGVPLAIPLPIDGVLSLAANNIFCANGPVGNMTFTFWGTEE